MYVDSVDTAISARTNPFLMCEDLIVFDTDKLDRLNANIFKYHNIIIVCDEIDKALKEEYNDYVVEFPELEKWHIEDYILSNCGGLNTEDATRIAALSNYDIYRVSNEVGKISIFDPPQQKLICMDLLTEDFLDISNYDIFSLVNPIISHDYSKLTDVWKKVSTFDSDPMYLLSVLIGQYKTIINVLLYPNSTPDNCGISQKRFNAIKYYYKNYTKKQLVETYSFLNDVDRQLKVGELSDISLLDYIIVNTIQRGTAA